MTERDPTCIGRVKHVLGGTVTVALDSDVAGVAPVYRGRLHPVGQIGSLVRLPQGLVDLVGSVSLLGIAELAGAIAPAETIQVGERWLQVQLLGQIDRGTGRFERGVAVYPGLDDPVHFATAEELSVIYPLPDTEHVPLGRLAASEDVLVCLNAGRLVVRHSAVVGSTGSGKSSAVASLLQQLASGGWSAANVVLVDPHGEYKTALAGNASVRSVLPEGAEEGLRVPYWALPASSIIKVFAGSEGGASTKAHFRELVQNARRSFVTEAEWLELDPAAVTADTPVPFDLRDIWFVLDSENNETREVSGDPETACVEEAGDAASLRPTRFKPHGPGSTPPHKGPSHGIHGRIPELLRLGLLDPRLKFLQEPAADPNVADDPLIEVVHDWLGRESGISVLDFSGVPTEAADLAIGVLLSLLFEVALRCDPDGEGIGRPSPVLVVLEEAHRYLGSDASALTRESANRIAREGRKYGVGIMLVSQRPDELPKTALAQCGTLIALRLSNAGDQGTIRAALPDSVSGLASVLPSLRTGEAVVSGEAVIVPSRVLITAPDPPPHAADPSLERWRGERVLPALAEPLAEWRGTYET